MEKPRDFALRRSVIILNSKMCKGGSAEQPNPDQPVIDTTADTGPQHDDDQAQDSAGNTQVGLLIQIAESRLAVEPCPRCRSGQQEYVARSLQDGFLDISLVIDQCQMCGYRKIVVDESGPANSMGRLLTLSVQSAIDLQRDAAISSTASLSIPEIGLDLGRGQLGCQFTKVGKLLDEIYASLDHPDRQLMEDNREEFDAFMRGFRSRIDSACDFTVVIDDPYGRSLVSGLNATNISVQEYARPEDDQPQQ